MSTEINKEQILEKHSPSMSILFLDDVGRAYREKILSAMEEYTSQWKLKYDELKERYERYEATRHNGVPGFENVYQAAYADACDQWKDKYDELKAENERLNDSCKKLFEQNCRFHNEHAALKDRAQGLVDALGKLNEAIDKTWNECNTMSIPDKYKKEILAAQAFSYTTLQSWNQGNEVLGKEGEV